MQVVQHTTVLGFLGRFIRRLRVGHKNQLGAQQANAFGALLNRGGHTFALTNVGEYFNGMPVQGDGWLMAQLRGGQQALFTAVTLIEGALQGIRIGSLVQATALAVDQQLRAWRQQQHRVTGTHQSRNAQGARNDGAVCGGPALYL